MEVSVTLERFDCTAKNGTVVCSHCKVSSTDSKVRTSLHVSIITSESEQVNT